MNHQISQMPHSQLNLATFAEMVDFELQKILQHSKAHYVLIFIIYSALNVNKNLRSRGEGFSANGEPKKRVLRPAPLKQAIAIFQNYWPGT